MRDHRTDWLLNHAVYFIKVFLRPPTPDDPFMFDSEGNGLTGREALERGLVGDLGPDVDNNDWMEYEDVLPWRAVDQWIGQWVEKGEVTPSVAAVLRADYELATCGDAKRIAERVQMQRTPDDLANARSSREFKLEDIRDAVAEPLDALDAHRFSMVIDQFDPLDRVYQLAAWELVPRSKWPKWAGSPSYAQFAEYVDTRGAVEWFGAPNEDDSMLSPLGSICLKATTGLRKARPIVFDKAQLDVLPQLRDAEAWDYAMKLQLPFESCYLDFMSPDGKTTPECTVTWEFEDESRTHELTVALAGVLFTRAKDDIYLITPYQALYDKVTETCVLAPTGEVAVLQNDQTPLPPVRWPMKSTQQVGGGLYGISAFLTDREIPRSPAPADLAGRHTEDVIAEFGRPCWPIGVMPALDKRTVLDAAQISSSTERYVEATWDPRDVNEDVMKMERALCFTTAVGASYGLSAMYFIEALNVEVVDVPMHRRDRKRAEKRNWPIASTVRVHRTIRRSSSRSEGTGDGNRLTYQTQTAGHYNHVTKGSHVRCRKCGGEQGRNVEKDGVIVWQECAQCKATGGLDPELVKPCPRRDKRTGALTCPDGCRREWVPDHWRGPADAPAVPKLRKVA